MKVALGSDHAGFSAKGQILEFLKGCGIHTTDFGVHSEDSVDYPDIAVQVARSVASGETDRGILVCGTGIGMAITANKVKGIRAALCCNEEMARLSREHNNANVLTVGGRQLTWEVIKGIVDAFLNTPFQPGNRHERRINKIHDLTQR